MNSGKPAFAFFAIFVMSAFGLWVGGCGPDYPECEDDSHCTTEVSKKSVPEYCVNSQCMECRENTHCMEGRECRGGRCEPIPGWCRDDSMCGSCQKCTANRCGPQCTADAECGGGKMKCEGGCCIQGPECNVSEDCRDGYECVGGSCVPKRLCEPATIHFDFDSAVVRSDARSTMDSNISCLKSRNVRTLVIEGYADERGTSEYNLALGNRRANAAKRYMMSAGMRGALKTVSYGEERPVSMCHDESCWSQNRRDEFKVQ